GIKVKTGVHYPPVVITSFSGGHCDKGQYKTCSKSCQSSFEHLRAGTDLPSRVWRDLIVENLGGESIPLDESDYTGGIDCARVVDHTQDAVAIVQIKAGGISRA